MEYRVVVDERKQVVSGWECCWSQSGVTKRFTSILRHVIVSDTEPSRRLSQIARPILFLVLQRKREILLEAQMKAFNLKATWD